MESTLLRKTWLKSALIEEETIDHYLSGNQEVHQSNGIELQKCLEILCTQTRQLLEYEISLELQLKQFFALRKRQLSH